VLNGYSDSAAAGLPRPQASNSQNSPARLPLPRPTSRIAPSAGGERATAPPASLRGSGPYAQRPTGSTAAVGGGGGEGGAGVESWKRAAEVTQNLKARIEMMKVCPCTGMTRVMELH